MDGSTSRDSVRLRERESLSRSVDGVPCRETVSLVEARRTARPIRPILEDLLGGVGDALGDELCDGAFGMSSRDGVCLKEPASLSPSELGLPDLVNLVEVRRTTVPRRPHLGLVGGVDGAVLIEQV